MPFSVTAVRSNKAIAMRGGMHARTGLSELSCRRSHSSYWADEKRHGEPGSQRVYTEEA